MNRFQVLLATTLASNEPDQNEIMPKPLSRKRRDEIRAEVWAKAERPNEPAIDDRVMMLPSCGHEEMVAPALNPDHAVCSQCRQKSLLSGT
jgi:hypothetical protein